MPRIVSPPLDELHTLRTPLNEGERIVLDFFLRNLPEKWEIYIQPHLNGLRPDFVLINPNVGIAVYEIKHWDLDAMPYRIVHNELWATNKLGIDFQSRDNPVDKVIHYRDQIINLYAPLIGQNCDEGNKSYLAIVTAGVIFTKAKTERVQRLLKPLYEKYPDNSQNYLPLVGIDELQANRLNSVFPSAKWQTSRYMKSEIADALRGWLIEPDFAQTQRQPLELGDPKQKSLATTRTASVYRRIRGSAGSGKSLVLAARAAQLSAQGKNVLMVTFNITLWHYLRDLVVRYPDPRVKHNKNVTYTHFHEWCKDIIVSGGLKHLYDELFASKPQGDELATILEYRISEIANKAIDNLENNVGQEPNCLEKYDAILVDEGQDFNLEWWNTLRRVLKLGGEIVLVVDETQDIYDRAKKWTEESMNNAGFRGVWSQLDICYRTPPKLIVYLQSFVQKFLLDSNISLINAEPTLELDLYPVTLSWIQTDSEHLVSKLCAEAALNIPKFANPDSVAFSDLILLLPNHEIGLACVKILEKHNFNILHVFNQNRKEQKSKKMSFFMGDSRIKACTIHSFKGWEARYMVIAITKSTDLAAAYVAISRLKRHTKGSYLTVVCSNPELEEYGKTWESFSRISNSRDRIVHHEIDDIPY